MEENENNNNNNQTRLFCDHGHEINEANDDGDDDDHDGIMRLVDLFDPHGNEINEANDDDVRQCNECSVNVKKDQKYFSCLHRKINLEGNDICAVILCE
eukprot:481855_1